MYHTVFVTPNLILIEMAPPIWIAYMQVISKKKANLNVRITDMHTERRTLGCTRGSNGKKKTSSITRNRGTTDGYSRQIVTP